MKKNEILTAKTLKSFKEYDNHFKVVHFVNKEARLEGYIAIHRRNRNLPSFGATRFWKYSNKKDAISDALRLSRLMSYKSALSGLPYGGAKAVIIKPKGDFSRKLLFKAYAEELNKLSGDFITGTDVGVSLSDLESMKKYTKYLVGYTSNPEKATSIGVIESIDMALKYCFGNNKYSNYSFAIQGIGKVGEGVLNSLVDGEGKDIYISDIDKDKIQKIIKKYPFVKVVDTKKIHKQKVDVFCPCALSGVLNKDSIKELQCKIIAGSANNQLESEIIGKKLYDKNILYCPDYIVNAGGLVSVIDEYVNGNYDENRLNKKISKIPLILKDIFNKSKLENKPPFLVSGDIGLSILDKNK